MPSLTIRNIEPETKDELRRRAAAHNRSMEDEARRILRDALGITKPKPGSLYERIRARVETIGGVDLDLPSRAFSRDPPTFE